MSCSQGLSASLLHGLSVAGKCCHERDGDAKDCLDRIDGWRDRKRRWERLLQPSEGVVAKPGGRRWVRKRGLSGGCGRSRRWVRKRELGGISGRGRHCGLLFSIVSGE